MTDAAERLSAALADRYRISKPVERAAGVEPVIVLNWAEDVKRLMLAVGVK